MIVYGDGYNTSERFLKFITKRISHPFLDENERGIKGGFINWCTFVEDDVRLVAEYCNSYGYTLAIWARNKDEILQANALNANFILIEKDLLPQVQELKQNLNFQSQFLLIVNSNENFAEFKDSGIYAMVIKNYLYKRDEYFI